MSPFILILVLVFLGLIGLSVLERKGLIRRSRAVILSLAVIFLFLLACMGLDLPVKVLFYLAFGWAIYCWRVLPKVQLNVSALLTAGVCLTVLGVGLHLFLRWFYSQAKTTTPPARRWPARWTAMGLGLVVLMFVAGIAFVGVTHQTAWLLTSPEPLIEYDAWYQRFREHIQAPRIQSSEPDTTPASSASGSVDAP